MQHQKLHSLPVFLYILLLITTVNSYAYPIKTDNKLLNTKDVNLPHLLYISTVDSTSDPSDTITVDEEELHIKKKRSSKISGFNNKSHSISVESGIPLSQFDFQYGIVYSPKYYSTINYSFYFGIDKFTYSTDSVWIEQTFDTETNNWVEKENKTEKTKSFYGIQYGIWGVHEIKEKIWLRFRAGGIIPTSEGKYPLLIGNIRAEGIYFFTKELAGGLGIRFLFGREWAPVYIPSASLNIIF